MHAKMLFYAHGWINAFEKNAISAVSVQEALLDNEVSEVISSLLYWLLAEQKLTRK